MRKCDTKDRAHTKYRELSDEFQRMLLDDDGCYVDLQAWLTQDADHMAVGVLVCAAGCEKLARMMPQVEIINLEEALGIKPKHHN